MVSRFSWRLLCSAIGISHRQRAFAPSRVRSGESDPHDDDQHIGHTFERTKTVVGQHGTRRRGENCSILHQKKNLPKLDCAEHWSICAIQQRYHCWRFQRKLESFCVLLVCRHVLQLCNRWSNRFFLLFCRLHNSLGMHDSVSLYHYNTHWWPLAKVPFTSNSLSLFSETFSPALRSIAFLALKNRLDHVFHSPSTVALSCDVMAEFEGNASDHLPIATHFRLASDEKEKKRAEKNAQRMCFIVEYVQV